MKNIFVSFVIIQCFMLVISSTDAQRSLQEYLHLSGFPYPITPVSAPPYNRAALNPHSHVPEIQVKQSPPTTDPTLSALSLANLLAGLSQSAVEKQQPVQNPAPPTNIDATLLNNLAVALQLLIVSNILHSPPPGVLTEKPEIKSEPVYYTPETKSTPHQVQYYMPQDFVPYTQSNSAQKCELSKKSLPVIQSPYEAMSSSPYSDPLVAYSPVNSRKDLLSPYAMIAKDTNLFSFNDLF